MRKLFHCLVFPLFAKGNIREEPNQNCERNGLLCHVAFSTLDSVCPDLMNGVERNVEFCGFDLDFNSALLKALSTIPCS